MKILTVRISRNSALLMWIFVLMCAWTLRGMAGIFDDANRAFAEGHYEESIKGYLSILDQKGYSSAVLFNLGNAYLQKQEFGRAILAYKRALWLAPRDPDIAANLRYAQKQAGLIPTENSWLANATSAFSPNAWAWLSVLAMFSLCGNLLALYKWKKLARSLGWIAAASGLVWLLAAGALFDRYEQQKEGVILAKEAPVLISPFPSAKEAFTLPSGETVTISHGYQDYLLINDEAGHVGWVNKQHIGRIF